MTDKELKKLNREDLLEMLLDMSRENDRLKSELAESAEKLKTQDIQIAEAGSLAEAALQLSGIFERAQQAADIYLTNLSKRAEKQKQVETDANLEIEEVKIKAVREIDEMKEQAVSKVQEAKAKAADELKKAQQQAETIRKTAEKEASDIRLKAQKDAEELMKKAEKTLEDANKAAKKVAKDNSKGNNSSAAKAQPEAEKKNGWPFGKKK